MKCVVCQQRFRIIVEVGEGTVLCREIGHLKSVKVALRRFVRIDDRELHLRGRSMFDEGAQFELNRFHALDNLQPAVVELLGHWIPFPRDIKSNLINGRVCDGLHNAAMPSGCLRGSLLSGITSADSCNTASTWAGASSSVSASRPLKCCILLSRWIQMLRRSICKSSVVRAMSSSISSKTTPNLMSHPWRDLLHWRAG